MVRSHSRGDAKLEIFCLLNELPSEIPRVEWGGYEDLSIDDMLLEIAFRPLFATRNLF